MITLSKVISTAVSSAKRLVKVLYKGNDDFREMRDATPYGIDSNPVKDMIAVYAHTQGQGSDVIIGYVNKNALAAVGELRLFSTDADGEEQMYAWLKNDGTMELGGDADFMVRYNELETAFNQLRSDFNDLVTLYNVHTHATVTSLGTPTPPAGAPAQPSTADITPAKIEEIKTTAA